MAQLERDCSFYRSKCQELEDEQKRLEGTWIMNWKEPKERLELEVSSLKAHVQQLQWQEQQAVHNLRSLNENIQGMQQENTRLAELAQVQADQLVQYQEQLNQQAKTIDWSSLELQEGIARRVEEVERQYQQKLDDQYVIQQGLTAQVQQQQLELKSFESKLMSKSTSESAIDVKKIMQCVFEKSHEVFLTAEEEQEGRVYRTNEVMKRIKAILKMATVELESVE